MILWLHLFHVKLVWRLSEFAFLCGCFGSRTFYLSHKKTIFLEEKKMKKLKSVVCLFLALLMLGSLCACGNSGSTEDRVRSVVEIHATREYLGSSIGGNDLASSRATISNVRKVSDLKYIVSGKMVMTDIYGTKWSNNFDCTVTSSDGETWSTNFRYTSNTWSRN